MSDALLYLFCWDQGGGGHGIERGGRDNSVSWLVGNDMSQLWGGLYKLKIVYKIKPG